MSVDICPRVVDLAKPAEEVTDGVSLRVQFGICNFIPVQRRGDRRPGPCAHCVGGN